MSLWPINPPSKQDLMNALMDTSIVLYMSFSWEMHRTDVITGAARGDNTQPMSFDTRLKFASMFIMRDPIIILLLDVLNRTDPSGDATVTLPFLFPKFIHAYPSGQTVNLAPNNQLLVNCTLAFKQVASGDIAWWELSEPSVEGGRPTLYILSDNIPAISSLSSYGIIGLYVAVVFAVGRFIRMMVTDLTLKIMYEDLPNPDPLLEMCSHTLLARYFFFRSVAPTLIPNREFGDFETEETLYWQLVTLFRSPADLMEKTRLIV